MTNKTKAKLDKIENGSLIRDVIIGVATAFIGVGAGRTMVKEAKTEVAVSSLKNDVSNITAEVSTIKNDVSNITAEVSTIKNEVSSIATKQNEQDDKLDQILSALKPKTTTPGTPAPTPAPTTPTGTPTNTPTTPLNPRNPRRSRP